MSVLLIESGRLGNQLFQYAAVRSHVRDEALWLIGFDDVLSAFEGVEARQLLSGNRLAGRLVRRWRPSIDIALGHSHLLPAIAESLRPDALEIERIGGRLRGPTYVLTGYFQSPAAFDSAVIAPLSVRAALDAHARAHLQRISPSERPRIFVHVRRGDYATWPSASEPAMLPDEWYRERMDELRLRLRNPYFVLVTDDVPYVSRAFADVADGSVFHADVATEFAAMCACDGGILSPSSFSWWAAYFINRRFATASLVAPLFWIGHRKQQWYPPAIATPFLEYRAVRSVPIRVRDV
jgi:hypothetical protein